MKIFTHLITPVYADIVIYPSPRPSNVFPRSYDTPRVLSTFLAVVLLAGSIYAGLLILRKGRK